MSKKSNVDNVIRINEPEIQSTFYYFDTEDEAHMFVAAVKEDLANNEHFDFVDYSVEQLNVGEPLPEQGGELVTYTSWRGRVDYIDRTPPAPVAA